MNERTASIADKATKYWGLHQWWDHRAGVVTRCLAFVVDERYVTSPSQYDPNEQLRLGASFGENPFPMEMKRGFLTPWPLPSKYVLGLHWVGTCGRVIRLYDQWSDGPFDADASGGDPARGEELARALLASLDDAEYAGRVYSGLRECRPTSISGRSPFSLDGAVLKGDDEW